MVSIRFILTSLEQLGLLNLREKKEDRCKHYFGSVWMFVQMSLQCVFACTHLHTTLTKCSRYKPEFFEALFEDSYIISGSAAILTFNLCHKELLHLMRFMEKSFSKADPVVIQSCQSNCKIVFAVISGFIVSSMCLYVTESFLPLSEEELAIRRMVYDTNHPERRLPYHFAFSFNEEDVWKFWVTFACELYIILLNGSILTLCTTFIPIVLLSLQAQYKILAKYIAKIGQKHINESGNEIFYSNIEKNDFYCVIRIDKSGRKIDRRVMLKRRRCYEQHYIKQIVRYHQKLLRFQDEVGNSGLTSTSISEILYKVLHKLFKSLLPA